MYLYIENLTESELTVLNELFKNRISAFKDMHYLVCVMEIMNALQKEAKDYESITQNPMFGTYISEMADSLYHHSNDEFHSMHETAIEIVNCH